MRFIHWIQNMRYLQRGLILLYNINFLTKKKVFCCNKVIFPEEKIKYDVIKNLKGDSIIR